MCGIVGYIGHQQAVPILLNGLKRLEYRGYDSAGVAVYQGDSIEVIKAKGRLNVLESALAGRELRGTLGIGHTRWATHGEPSDVNSHPHTDASGEIAVVHNGIIENYIRIKQWLQEQGTNFVSDTDTEVIAHLIHHFYEDDLLSAVQRAVSYLEGSYALAVMCRREPDKLIAVRKDSPLIIGLGDGENFIASDIPAILPYTREVYFLNDKELAVLTCDGVSIKDEYGRDIKRDVYHVTWDIEAAEKGGFEHFMLKEIHEQPKALRDTMASRIAHDLSINLHDLDDIDIEKAGKLFIVACGTAYHAGVVGKYLIERMARLPVEVDIASEFRYRQPIISKGDLAIVISQSGETADTLAALRELKRQGATVIAIANVVGSTITREANKVLYTWAGPEIAVASTKAYTTQLLVITMIALYMAKRRGAMKQRNIDDIVSDIIKLPDKAQSILNGKEAVQHYAAQHFSAHSIFFIGRGLDYALAMEGSLKLKEISYIHSEAYAAGELKHGTIALIEPGTLVVALATQPELFDKMLSNIKEVKARGAVVMAVVQEGNTAIEDVADYVIYLPDTSSWLVPMLGVIPLQLFAYYTALYKGCDVDKPRNLAKSVTVE
ncbi:glutamine--fructose-6-phosphate transaminase (isomerizing) [Mahella australiensis]|uniref:Glutamine--fructose-6-phosphate aminotransferase [isomerizing] n=1 Tax=Mahella australiensis (strain DSM 15567 / CIP 107919 / 50-1 BON) TaxID=697281 RepID=F4A0J3_MAHA5|nr:glutamine--fructose-6-phosphate transaminase (isomerizing) [Mahella australiensis]AEE95872.1 glutamine--fructose-6-phosphate transaminase [Mahella australiensis 50-1 BON]